MSSQTQPLRNGALTAAGLLIASLGLASCDAVDYAESYSVDEPVQRVVVDVDNGDLQLISSFDEGVRVRRTVEGWKGSLELETRVVGDTLYIDAHCVGLMGCRVDSVIEVPAGTELLVTLGSGELELVGHQGIADLAVGEGSVVGSGLASSELDVTVASGTVTLELDREVAALRVAVGQGDVSVATPGGSYDLYLETGSGQVSVEGLEQSQGAAGIDVTVANGDVLVASR